MGVFARSILFIFSMVTILFPSFILNKLLFVVMLSLVGLFTISKATIERLYSPFIVLAIYIVGAMFAFLTEFDSVLLVQFLFSVFILFMIFYIKLFEIKYEKILYFCIVFMSILTVLVFVIYSTGLLGGLVATIFEVHSLGVVGGREIGSYFLYMIHFGSAPILFIGFVICINHMLEDKSKLFNFLIFIILIFSIFISSSRALIFISAAYLFLIVFMRFGIVMKSVISFFVLLFILVADFGFLYEAFSSSEPSNMVKIGHITGFLDGFNLWNIFIGNGLATYYYSYGSGSFLSHTEITLLDQFRYFGVLLTVVLYACLIFPRVNLGLKYKPSLQRRFIGFLMYLVLSLTNPVLFNGFGLLVVLWWWSLNLVEDKRYD